MKILSTITTLAIVTVIMLLIYAGVQQNYRSNANDPQIQIARDIRIHLKEGRTVQHIFPADSIDISKSLGVFAVLYNDHSKPLKSSGSLNGNMPQLPSGVFDFAKAHGEDAITWQPQHGVRMAMVVVSVQSPEVGYVAVGRSLQEVEIRESNLVKTVFVCWVTCIGIIIINSIIQFRFKRK